MIGRSSCIYTYPPNSFKLTIVGGLQRGKCMPWICTLFPSVVGTNSFYICSCAEPLVWLGSLSGNPLPMNWYSETSPCGHLSKVVTYDIAVSRDGPKIFANMLLFILAPSEWSLINTDNGHYCAGSTASEHNKCNSLITILNVVCT